MRLHVGKRIYPNRKTKEYFMVYIFRDRETMHKFWEVQLKAWCVPEKARFFRFEAQTSWWRRFKVSRKGDTCPLNSVGQVIFYAGFLGAGIVAHEFTHASSFYWEKKKGKRWNPKMSNEHNELQADSVGYMVGQFFKWYWKREKAIKTMAVTR